MKILSGLSENQVLQRVDGKGASVHITGTCSGNDTIHATLSHRNGSVLTGWRKRPSGSSSRGAFAIHLSKIPAGGPYHLELQCGKQKVHIASFFVGDVWVLAGQSNMEGCGNMTGAAKAHPSIKSFSMRREWRQATEPLHVLGESPDPCHNNGNQFSVEAAERYRKSAVKGVGAGLFFASEMLGRSGVPQGLICTAHGGTSMSQWDPSQKDQGENSMYGSMLLSVRATGQPVAGVLWYQGESDASDGDALLYTERMRKLVAASRRDLRQAGLHWAIVQLARVFGGWGNLVAWNSIQEQQRLLPGKIKNLATVAAIDLPLDDNIHISAEGYPRLAARLAHTADSLVYGNKKAGTPPEFKSVTVGPSKQAIDVVFDHLQGDLRSAGEPQGFTLLDAEGRVWPFIFKTTLHGDTVRLHLGAPLFHEARLSYGHGVTPVCNITDGRDYSLPVFGPIAIHKQRAWLPFVITWKRTDVVPASKPLKEIACPDAKAFEALNATVKTFDGNGFVNEHPLWEGKSGHAYFSTQIQLPEPMKLQFLMGYDGPFRLWLDKKPFFTNLAGTNPCLADESAKTIALKAGTHEITVAMDTNGGRAWGFFLRFCRRDVSAASIRKGDYAKPSYGF